VHIREPFYPDPEEQLKPDEGLKIINRAITFHDLSAEEYDPYLQKLKSFEKVLIIAGQNQPDEAMSSILAAFSNATKIPVIGEITSNLNNGICLADLIVSQKKSITELKPDLLITFGGSVISKNLKTFIRKNKPGEHWHITEYDHAPDTFQSLTNVIAIRPAVFFKHLIKMLTGVKQSQSEYLRQWKDQDMKISNLVGSFLKDQPFGDWAAVKTVLEHLPKQTGLHLANSMSVRYASLSGPFNRNKFSAYSNRGTSGIDGCTSTAVGHAIADERLQVLITGDQAFIYDRNALWHRHMPANLRIVIINNRGGGIFRLIDGPANQPELEKYFEAGQFLTAERLAADHGLEYASCSNREGLEVMLKNFFAENPRPKILEVFADPETNQGVFSKLKYLLSQL
jgi:2-succinyl-5-enolpyruvyl-6-hydroxy-3-cyclohexene-1-carboxylate synthase